MSNNMLRSQCVKRLRRFSAAPSTKPQLASIYITPMPPKDVYTFLQSTVRCRYNAVIFIKNIRKRHPMSYGVSFRDSASAWYSASVSAMIYAISSYIRRSRYNGTRLYCDFVHGPPILMWAAVILLFLFFLAATVVQIMIIKLVRFYALKMVLNYFMYCVDEELTTHKDHYYHNNEDATNITIFWNICFM